MLWILSYHEFSHSLFEDNNLAIIEKVIKLLDYHSKEKLVRIILMLIDNLKEVKGGCEEHMADIDAYSIILKLQNRHWIDPDLTKMLDDLEAFFE